MLCGGRCLTHVIWRRVLSLSRGQFLRCSASAQSPTLEVALASEPSSVKSTWEAGASAQAGNNEIHDSENQICY